ncbi:MAG: AzlC family ABC transporter permease [Acidimicrobiales bacterium]|nr:AzlC family ABC transporter permease [Acidimicrobiales bacterium]
MKPFSRIGRGELAALVASYAVGGISVALVCAGFGADPWVIILASIVMYSATGELALVAVLSAGGSTATAMASALLVSARFGVLAAGLSSRLRHVPLSERVVAAFLVVDPPTALAMAEPDDDHARRQFWYVTLWMGAGWVAGSVIGVLAHTQIGDPKAFGLDAVIPASLIALLGAPMRSGPGRVTALAAAATCLALTPVLPAGLPVLVALVAVPIGLRSPARPGHRRAG